MAELTAEQILAQQTKEWQDAEANATWYPPEDGVFTARIASVEAVTKGRGDNARTGIDVSHEIVDGPYEGKSHPAGFWAGKGFFMAKNYIAALGADPDDYASPVEALEFLKTKVNTVVSEQISTREYTDRAGNQKTARNVEILSVLQS